MWLSVMQCEIHDLFSGLSGFTWNQTSKIYKAEDEV